MRDDIFALLIAANWRSELPVAFQIMSAVYLLLVQCLELHVRRPYDSDVSSLLVHRSLYFPRIR